MSPADVAHSHPITITLSLLTWISTSQNVEDAFTFDKCKYMVILFFAYSFFFADCLSHPDLDLTVEPPSLLSAAEAAAAAAAAAALALRAISPGNCAVACELC